MIIRKLTMHNFGVYAGTNTFYFNSDKPIVLIGGMNGRGKTTFLEAILLSLYGSNSFAYKESRYNTYGKYLRAYVNKNDWSQTCYVELEFEIEQKEPEVYLVHREWNSLTQRIHEEITVYKNGEENEFLTKNWSMFVENMIPSALSSFFFFDGEKIAELAVDDTNKQMKDSIRSMLGISVLDVLKNDLNRNLRKFNKKSTENESLEELETLRSQRDEVNTKLDNIDQEINQLVEKENALHAELESLHNAFEAKGGDAFAERQKLIEEKAELSAEYDHISDRLIEIASAELPLSLVKDLINDIKLQAEDEHSDRLMMMAVEQMDWLFKDFCGEDKGNHEDTRVFLEFVRKRAEDDRCETIYDLSDQALFQVSSLVEERIDQTTQSMAELLKRKDELAKKIKELDSYLLVDINEKELNKIQQKIKEIEKKLINVQIKIGTLQQNRVSINSSAITLNAEFNRYVEKYLLNVEAKDDNERKIKYSNLALKILEKYTEELQKAKTGSLAKTITKCYKLLANKKNMIDTIVMDARNLDLEYLDENSRSVSKDSLSAGEKQLMVIAILWALAICSKKKLPVIIDTPLSRLDSQHRTSIITTYFPNASDQTIILSTDTEIDLAYYELMKENVGDEFTLIYNETTKSTSIRRGYFQENV